MKKLSIAAAALALLVSTAACSTSLKAEPDEVATKAAEALEQQVGILPVIDCGQDKIEIVEGKVITCALSVDGEADVYDVDMTVTKVEGTNFEFDIKVADQPRP